MICKGSHQKRMPDAPEDSYKYGTQTLCGRILKYKDSQLAYADNLITCKYCLAVVISRLEKKAETLRSKLDSQCTL